MIDTPADLLSVPSASSLPPEAQVHAFAAALACPEPARPRRRRPAGVLRPVRRSFHDAHYELRYPDGAALRLARDHLPCLYDLTMQQLRAALRVCLTTVKKLRVWSGLTTWPRADVLRGRHPTLTVDGVRQLRADLMAALDPDADAQLLAVLRRAQLLAMGHAAESLAPGPAASPEGGPSEGAEAEALPCFDDLDDLDLDGLLPSGGMFGW